MTLTKTVLPGCAYLTPTCSWHTYKLLVYMHEVPDLDNKAGGGIQRLDRYDQLAEYILGKRKGKLVLMPFQLAVLVGIAITYTVVGGDNLAAFAKNMSPAHANFGNWAYFLMFGGLQMALSMVRSSRWLLAATADETQALLKSHGRLGTCECSTLNVHHKLMTSPVHWYWCWPW